MKKLVCLSVALIIFLLAAPAFALTLSLEPPMLPMTLGGTVAFDLNVSGLGSGDAVSAFSMDITYDSAAFAFNSVSFGSFLGDINLLQADAYADGSVAGRLYLDGVSWLPDSVLVALQPGSFTLATINFTVANVGFSSVNMENVILSDASGYTVPDITIKNADVAPVPEPATFLLFGAGLVGLCVLGRKRFHH